MIINPQTIITAMDALVGDEEDSCLIGAPFVYRRHHIALDQALPLCGDGLNYRFSDRGAILLQVSDVAFRWCVVASAAGIPAQYPVRGIFNCYCLRRIRLPEVMQPADIFQEGNDVVGVTGFRRVYLRPRCVVRSKPD